MKRSFRNLLIGLARREGLSLGELGRGFELSRSTIRKILEDLELEEKSAHLQNFLSDRRPRLTSRGPSKKCADR